MIVTLDKQTGDIILSLPEGHKKYEKELRLALYDEFAFEPVNKMVLSRMNRFVEEWFNKRGIKVEPEEKAE